MSWFLRYCLEYSENWVKYNHKKITKYYPDVSYIGSRYMKTHNWVYSGVKRTPYVCEREYNCSSCGETMYILLHPHKYLMVRGPVISSYLSGISFDKTCGQLIMEAALK